MGPARAGDVAASRCRAWHLAQPLDHRLWTDIEIEDIPDALKGILKQQIDLRGRVHQGRGVPRAGRAGFRPAALFERNLAPIGSRRARRVAMVNNWLLFPLFILASIGLLIY